MDPRMTKDEETIERDDALDSDQPSLPELSIAILKAKVQEAAKHHTPNSVIAAAGILTLVVTPDSDNSLHSEIPYMSWESKTLHSMAGKQLATVEGLSEEANDEAAKDEKCGGDANLSPAADAGSLGEQANFGDSTKSSTVSAGKAISRALTLYEFSKFGNFDVGDYVQPEFDEMKIDPLLTISRSPIRCPVNFCPRSVGLTSLMSHFLRDHASEFGLQVVNTRTSAEITFNYLTVPNKCNYCFGLLAYGGTTLSHHDMAIPPAERGICMRNAFLPHNCQHLEGHLPILVVCSKTTWGAMLPSKHMERDANSTADEDQSLLLIWLVSAPTTVPLFCTVTVFNQLKFISRSIIMRIRHFDESQDPTDFLWQEQNIMRLGTGDIKALSNNFDDEIRVEVRISDYENEASLIEMKKAVQ